jgi:ABC-type multidrug transport system fused ATPase/permease subunit
VIGSEGRTLSAGEKQRLELARVLLRQPAVLVIDEGLSAVDPDTERSIYRWLFDADRRRSTIIIAHRLSSIIDCQRILVLDGGVIAASGAHRELIGDCVPYQRLFQEQTE